MKRELSKKLKIGLTLGGLVLEGLGISGCAKGNTYFPVSKDPNLDLRLVRNSQGDYSLPVLVYTSD